MTATQIPQVDLDLIEHYATMNLQDPRLKKAFPTKESINVLGTAMILLRHGTPEKEYMEEKIEELKVDNDDLEGTRIALEDKLDKIKTSIQNILDEN